MPRNRDKTNKRYSFVKMFERNVVHDLVQRFEDYILNRAIIYMGMLRRKGATRQRITTDLLLTVGWYIERKPHKKRRKKRITIINVTP